ncbi:MAG: GNAT family N-acetyltransferase [Maledivibacter sp.]|jgi:GNAT superfamily N-acetyltransferase|nr:GNAT family N-acetyltransferase [Maledivibacter sp.]
MSEPRAAKLSEFDDVIDHINNVFRIKRGHAPTMQQEFPLLLSRENIDNIIVIKEEGKIVSAVNFLIQEILVEGVVLKSASIGAVCTDPDYERKGYSSKILDHVEKQLYAKGVDILLISGNRTLYTRRMATEVKCFYRYDIIPKDIGLQLSINDYNDKYLYEMLKRYNQNSTRFYRTKENFEILLESATIPWGNYSYKKLIVKKNGEFIGYIVLRIIDEEESWGQIIELSMPNKYVYDLLSHMAKEYSLKYIRYYVHVKDHINQLEEYDERKLDYLRGTVKVINFEQMMKKLHKYISQYIDGNIPHELICVEEDGIYKINYKENELNIHSLDDLNRLLFEHANKENEILDALFPLNFIWPANLNFQ